MVLVESPGEGAAANLTDSNSAPSPPSSRRAGTTLCQRNPGVDWRGLGKGQPEQGWLMLLYRLRHAVIQLRVLFLRLLNEVTRYHS